MPLPAFLFALHLRSLSHPETGILIPPTDGDYFVCIAPCCPPGIGTGPIPTLHML